MAETRLIQGRYRLLDLIGRGGMGEVWQARDESLGRRVAVKCLKPLGPQQDHSLTKIARERFRREARVAAALQHRGVTVVHDFGEHEGVLYLVMELLDGRNLSQLLEDNKQRPLPVSEVVDIAEQVSDALAYTHEQGIVHRDLKPANIMRLTDGTVKICDFGIARLGHDLGTSQLTGVGIAMGTPHYMSPEQIGAGQVDHRSDLYSLGCVLYEIATGAPPFDLDDAWAILIGHRDTAPESLLAHRPDLPEFFDRIVLDLLAKTPEGRPAHAGDVRRRISVARTVPGGRRTGQAFPAPDPGPAPPPPGGPGEAPLSSAVPTAWARSLTAGHRAVTGSVPRPAPADTAGLTGGWTGLADPQAVLPAGRPERPAPPPERLAALTRKHQAGLGLGRLGRWEEAGEVHRAVVAEREHHLGPHHPDTLGSRYEVAISLSRTGRTADALHEFGRVAEGRERTLGPDHPETLTARQEMAYVLGQLDRHFEAHEVYADVLASRQRTMGPEHPDTLRCRHNLAFNLRRLGRLEDAYLLTREVALARARVLGATHRDTLVSQYEIAYSLGQLGRWAEALDIYREVADGRAAVLGRDHPEALAVRYEVGISLGRLGRSADALEVYRGLVDDHTRVHGPEHPGTLLARHGLGVNLGRLDRWAEAVAEARDVFAVRARVLGHDHPDTLVSRREIAVGLGRLGRWADAMAVYRLVSEARERVLGVDHPDTLSSRSDEAHCLEQLGRSEEAAEVHRRVAALRRQGGAMGL